MKNIAQITQKVAFYAIAFALILTPLFFLPITNDFYSFNKQVLFLVFTVIAFLAFLIQSITNKTFRLTLSPLLLPLALFTASVITSTLLIKSTGGQLVAWMGRASLFCTAFIFYVIGIYILKSARQIRYIINGLLVSSSILAILGILSFVGVLANTNLPAYLIAKNFTPAGSPLILINILLITLPLGLILAFKSRPGPKKLAYFISSGIIISAVIIIGSALITGKNPAFKLALLPKLASWSIAIDSFKTSVLFGTGPNSFFTVFTKFKPVSINQTDLWNVNFAVSSNEYFHIMTTLGLAGIATFGLIIATWFKLSKRNPGTRITASQLALNTSIITTLILGLIFPFTNSIWIILTGLFILSTVLTKVKTSPKIKDVIITLNAISVVDPDTPTPVSTPTRANFSNLLPWIITVPVSIALIFLSISVTKIYAAEYLFQKSLKAAAENKGTETYNLQIAALQKNPNLDRYRLSYSNTNFALANSLAAKGDLTDQDKQNITQLIQQAIREAKLATQLNPQKANNWQNLASLYRNLINFAEGSDQFAIASYIRAIQLDPANPILRVELGGLFFGLNQYDDAVNRFLESIQLKPDYANGYYNLSAAYKKSAKIVEAYQAMQQVVALIEPGTDDSIKAQQELDALKAQLPQQDQQPPTESSEDQQLTEPETPPVAPEGLEENIEIEEPETPESSPQPSPQSSPEASAEPTPQP